MEWVASKKLQPSKVSGELVPEAPVFGQRIRKAISLFGIVLSISFLLAIVALNIAIYSFFANPANDKGALENSGAPTQLTNEVEGAAIMSVIASLLIMIFGIVFDVVVTKLIHFENHKMKSSHLAVYTWVQFLINFINNFALIIFSAIFKPIINMIKPGFSYYFGPLYCTNIGSGSTCMQSLVEEITIIFVSQLFVFQTIGWCFIYRFTKKAKRPKKGKVDPVQQNNVDPEVKRNKLILSEEDFQKEYQARVFLFGYITLFSSAFPFGPVIALLDNVLQLKLKLKEYLYKFARPFSNKAHGIGSWEVSNLGRMCEITLYYF